MDIRYKVATFSGNLDKSGNSTSFGGKVREKAERKFVKNLPDFSRRGEFVFSIFPAIIDVILLHMFSFYKKGLEGPRLELPIGCHWGGGDRNEVCAK